VFVAPPRTEPMGPDQPELAPRLQGNGVSATVLHPRVVRTAFRAEESVFFRLMLRLMQPFMRTAARGTATSTYLASSTQVDGLSGQYFAIAQPKNCSTSSYDSAAARRLWQVKHRSRRPHQGGLDPTRRGT
jgi:retinol dehydrogenase 14